MKIIIFASERDQSIVPFDPLYMHNFCISTSHEKLWTGKIFFGSLIYKKSRPTM